MVANCLPRHPARLDRCQFRQATWRDRNVTCAALGDHHTYPDAVAHPDTNTRTDLHAYTHRNVHTCAHTHPNADSNVVVEKYLSIPPVS